MTNAWKSACWSAPLIAFLFHAAAAEDLSLKQIFQGTMIVRTQGRDSVNVFLSIQSWGITGDRRGGSVLQEIPLQGFYLARLRSGEITSTIGGVTTHRSAGDYWDVGPGATMQVKALGDYAMLETTVVSKNP